MSEPVQGTVVVPSAPQPNQVSDITQRLGHFAAASLPYLGEIAQIALTIGVKMSPQAQGVAAALILFNQLHTQPATSPLVRT